MPVLPDSSMWKNMRQSLLHSSRSVYRAIPLGRAVVLCTEDRQRPNLGLADFHPYRRRRWRLSGMYVEIPPPATSTQPGADNRPLRASDGRRC